VKCSGCCFGGLRFGGGNTQTQAHQVCRPQSNRKRSCNILSSSKYVHLLVKDRVCPLDYNLCLRETCDLMGIFGVAFSYRNEFLFLAKSSFCCSLIVESKMKSRYCFQNRIIFDPMQKKPSCTVCDFDDVTLGSPAIYCEIQLEFAKAPTGVVKDPWLSGPTSRWVWFYVVCISSMKLRLPSYMVFDVRLQLSRLHFCCLPELQTTAPALQRGRKSLFFGQSDIIDDLTW